MGGQRRGARRVDRSWWWCRAWAEANSQQRVGAPRGEDRQEPIPADISEGDDGVIGVKGLLQRGQRGIGRDRVDADPLEIADEVDVVEVVEVVRACGSDAVVIFGPHSPGHRQCGRAPIARNRVASASRCALAGGVGALLNPAPGRGGEENRMKVSGGWSPSSSTR